MKQLLLAWKPPTEQEIVPKVSRNKNTTKAKLNGPTLGKSAPKKRLTTLKPVFPALLRRQHRQHCQLVPIQQQPRHLRLPAQHLASESAQEEGSPRLTPSAGGRFG